MAGSSLAAGSLSILVLSVLEMSATLCSTNMSHSFLKGGMGIFLCFFLSFLPTFTLSFYLETFTLSFSFSQSNICDPLCLLFFLLSSFSFFLPLIFSSLFFFFSLLFGVLYSYSILFKILCFHHHTNNYSSSLSSSKHLHFLLSLSLC